MNASPTAASGYSSLDTATFAQHERLVTLRTPLDAALRTPLTVARYTLHEGVDTLFSLRIDCLASSAQLDVASLLGKEITLSQRLADGGWRRWHAVVESVEARGSDGGVARYRIAAGPWLGALAWRRDSFVYQDKTAADVLAELFSDYPLSAHSFAHTGDLPTRPIRTQYRETDLAFVLRVLAEEGLSFRFDHDQADGDGDGRAARHTLVIFDAQTELPQAPGAAVRFHRSDATETEDAIGRFGVARRITANKVTRASWNDRALAAPAAQAQADIGELPELEDYEDTGYLRYADTGAAERDAQRGLRAHQARVVRYEGEGTARALAPGHRFTLSQHARYEGGDSGGNTGGKDGELRDLGDNHYVLLSITHEAANNLGKQIAEQLAIEGVEAGSYRNGFSAQPAAAAIAAPWRPRPQAPESMVALVMAASDAPISTGRDLRIKVQFPWQRGEKPVTGGLRHRSHGDDQGNAPGDDTSGTWLRVATWQAGPNWGGNHLPRHGTEVLVEFLDSDIDQPVVTAQLYNDADLPPWQAGVDTDTDHPGTLSGWHSKSLGDGGYNQWLLDDASEQLRVRMASSAGASQLGLGFLVAQRPEDTQRGAWRGTGFELRSDAWTVLRAGQGMLVSTTARALGESTAADTKEALVLLRGAQESAVRLHDSASQRQARGLAANASHDTLIESLDPQAKGRYPDAVSGQPARKPGDGAREGDAPVERIDGARMVLDSPETMNFATPATALLHAGENLHLTSQEDTLVSAAQTVAYASGQSATLYSHNVGVQVIAGGGPVSLHAHTDKLLGEAGQDITITSSTEGIEILAQQRITLQADGATVTLDGADIRFTGPAELSVKAASHSFIGPASDTASLPGLPQTNIDDPMIVTANIVHKAANTPIAALAGMAGLGGAGAGGGLAGGLGDLGGLAAQALPGGGALGSINGLTGTLAAAAQGAGGMLGKVASLGEMAGAGASGLASKALGALPGGIGQSLQGAYGVAQSATGLASSVTGALGGAGGLSSIGGIAQGASGLASSLGGALPGAGGLTSAVGGALQGAAGMAGAAAGAVQQTIGAAGQMASQAIGGVTGTLAQGAGSAVQGIGGMMPGAMPGAGAATAGIAQGVTQGVGQGLAGALGGGAATGTGGMAGAGIASGSALGGTGAGTVAVASTAGTGAVAGLGASGASVATGGGLPGGTNTSTGLAGASPALGGPGGTPGARTGGIAQPGAQAPAAYASQASVGTGNATGLPAGGQAMSPAGAATLPGGGASTAAGWQAGNPSASAPSGTTIATAGAQGVSAGAPQGAALRAGGAGSLGSHAAGAVSGQASSTAAASNWSGASAGGTTGSIAGASAGAGVTAQGLRGASAGTGVTAANVPGMPAATFGAAGSSLPGSPGMGHATRLAGGASSASSGMHALASSPGNGLPQAGGATALSGNGLQGMTTGAAHANALSAPNLHGVPLDSGSAQALASHGTTSASPLHGAASQAHPSAPRHSTASAIASQANGLGGVPGASGLAGASALTAGAGAGAALAGGMGGAGGIGSLASNLSSLAGTAASLGALPGATTLAQAAEAASALAARFTSVPQAVLTGTQAGTAATVTTGISGAPMHGAGIGSATAGGMGSIQGGIGASQTAGIGPIGAAIGGQAGAHTSALPGHGAAGIGLGSADASIVNAGGLNGGAFDAAGTHTIGTHGLPAGIGAAGTQTTGGMQAGAVIGAGGVGTLGSAQAGAGQPGIGAAGATFSGMGAPGITPAGGAALPGAGMNVPGSPGTGLPGNGIAAGAGGVATGASGAGAISPASGAAYGASGSGTSLPTASSTPTGASGAGGAAAQAGTAYPGGATANGPATPNTASLPANSQAATGQARAGAGTAAGGQSGATHGTGAGAGAGTGTGTGASSPAHAAQGTAAQPTNPTQTPGAPAGTAGAQGASAGQPGNAAPAAGAPNAPASGANPAGAASATSSGATPAAATGVTATNGAAPAGAAAAPAGTLAGATPTTTPGAAAGISATPATGVSVAASSGSSMSAAAILGGGGLGAIASSAMGGTGAGAGLAQTVSASVGQVASSAAQGLGGMANQALGKVGFATFSTADAQPSPGTQAAGAPPGGTLDQAIGGAVAGAVTGAISGGKHDKVLAWAAAGAVLLPLAGKALSSILGGANGQGGLGTPSDGDVIPRPTFPGDTASGSPGWPAATGAGAGGARASSSPSTYSGKSGSHLQYVNLKAREDRWNDGRALDSLDRQTSKPRIHVKFNKPGAHTFTIKVIPGKDNIQYSAREQGRRESYKDVSTAVRTYTTKADGTYIVDDITLPAAGLNTYTFEVRDSRNQLVMTETVETARRIYIQEVVLPGHRPGDPANDVSPALAEFKRLGIDVVQLPRVTGPTTGNINVDYEVGRQLLIGNASTSYLRSEGPAHEPYTIAVCHVQSLASKAGLNRVVTNAIAGPGQGGVQIPLLDPDGNPYNLWHGIDDEPWFINAEFTYVDERGRSRTVPFPLERLRPWFSDPTQPHECNLILARMNDFLPTVVSGTLTVQVYVITGVAAGVAYSGGNLIAVATYDPWERTATDYQLETLVHELGHAIGMTPSGPNWANDPNAWEDFDESKLDRIPNFYSEAGNHCHYGQPKMAEKQYVYHTGDCVMYGGDTTSIQFCPDCAKGVRKVDLSKGWLRFKL
ncbi:probable vgr related protein [plant metagenome]|uniref:Probable vgr related protein n=1 Tax=plant metagenome TaxID=1297885 RepID=A0A484PK41_9ZZZZ